MNTIIMNYHCKILIFILAFFAALSIYPEETLSETEEDRLLNEISETLNEMNTLKADFRQERTLWVFNDTLVTEGICYFEDPDKLRWEITSPFRTILIYNNEIIAKFDVSSDGIVKYNLGTEQIMKIVLNEIIYWMKGNFTEAKELYDLSIRRGSDYIIELIPRSEQMKDVILKIELEISRITLHMLSVSIYETQQDSIRIMFFNEVNNIVFEEDLFDTDNPVF
jgi:outer membrane lipoprotein carrier protein